MSAILVLVTGRLARRSAMCVGLVLLMALFATTAGQTAAQEPAGEPPAAQQRTAQVRTAQERTAQERTGEQPTAEAQLVGGSNVVGAAETTRVSTRYANGVIDTCTGTFVTRRWVLTAAHCLRTEGAGPSQPVSSIVVESAVTRFDESDPTYWRSAATNHAVHPDYSDETLRVAAKDLGLVRVGQLAPAHVRPVGFLAASAEPAWGQVLVPGTVAAVGTTSPDVVQLPDHVRRADFTTVTTTECAYEIASAGEQFSVSDAFCGRGGVRVGGGGADVCFGDSGSVLVVTTRTGRRVAAGVVSAGVSAQLCLDSLAVFSRLAPDAAWVSSVTGSPPVTEPVRVAGDPTAPPGYWLLERDGDVSTFGGAPVLGGVKDRLAPGATAVAIAARPQGDGYWVLTSDGDLVARGLAIDLGRVDLATLTKPGERVSTISAAPDGAGLWVFTTAGRVVAFGTALPATSLAGTSAILALTLHGPVVDSVAAPSGEGAYLTASDGGVFAVGSARFVGSLRGVLTARFGPPGLPHQPVVGVVADPDGFGYWTVGADGGVFSFEAPFRGSLPAIVPFHQLAAPVVGMVPFGDGYLLVASDGGVFNFSRLPFSGSGAGLLDSPVAGIAPTA